MTAQHLVNRSGGAGVRGQFHLALTEGGDALCGAVPPNAPSRAMDGTYRAGWPSIGVRAAFEEHIPHRICKQCRKLDERTG